VLGEEPKVSSNLSNIVNGPTTGENPLAVTSAEMNPPLGAPVLLSMTMSPPSVHPVAAQVIPAPGENVAPRRG
jgi:hypothetical protein